MQAMVLTSTGLLTGQHTLRRLLYLMGLSDSPLLRRCGAEDEPRPTFFVIVKLGFTQTCVSGLLLGARGHQDYVWWPSGTFEKQLGSHELIWPTTGPSVKT